MKPRRAAMPPGDPAGDPAEIEAYLEYAQENIERSRKLFKSGDLRYAIFSANEGLELFVKAHMLRYKIIGKARTAGHFPYPAVVESMKEVTKSNIDKNPANKKQLEQALDLLCTLEDVFNVEKNLQLEIWKSSLNVSLPDKKRRRVEKFWKRLDDWGKEMIQIQDRRQRPSKQGPDRLTPAEQDEFFAAILGVFKEKTGGSKGSQTLLLPRKKRMAYSSALYMGRLFALVELIVHMRAVVRSFVHQQVSRYPTQIDGVDSREIYMDHKDDVKALLKEIYATSTVLLRHLRHGDRLAVQSHVGVSSDMKMFLPP